MSEMEMERSGQSQDICKSKVSRFGEVLVRGNKLAELVNDDSKLSGWSIWIVDDGIHSARGPWRRNSREVQVRFLNLVLSMSNLRFL